MTAGTETEAGTNGQVERPVPRDVTFDELLRGRRSVRRMRTDAIPRDIIEAVLEAARWAPSPHGTQPWRFVVLQDRAVRERLTDAMAGSWQHNLAMDGQDGSIVQQRLEGSRRRMLEAPVLILVSLFTEDLEEYPDPVRQQSEITMAIQSLGACVQNMLLAAFRLGIDGGWMCAPLFCPDIVRSALDLPESHVPHALIPLGYAAADPKRRERRSLNDLITRWE
ncbi:MAG TPA: nitroreductase family protein [Nitrolancea sp.]|jgi:F420 biosynthesis protein FbiB-like protein|nr:nitroreductase family protein [Nitrolancea sp.]